MTFLLVDHDEAIAFDVFKEKVYVTNNLNDRVSVIDPNTNMNIKDITVGALPESIDTNGLTGLAYLANSRTISIIKMSDDTVGSRNNF